MAIKQILDKIKQTIGADAPAEISSLLADAMREADDMIDGLQAANRESKSRKEKIRELENQIEALNENLSKQNPDAQKAEIERLKGIEEKYNAFQSAQETELRNKWAEASKIFDIPTTDKRFTVVSGVKDRFKFSDEGKELAIDDIKANLSAYDLLNAAKAFDVQTGAPQIPPADPGKPSTGFLSSGAAIAAKLKSKS